VSDAESGPSKQALGEQCYFAGMSRPGKSLMAPIRPVAVTAVLVTFNRCQYLVGCITAVLSQTYVPGRLVIVDNASTDGTWELLKSHGYLDHPSISYHRLSKNTGGAGGFNFGLEWASAETQADWFWVMDDDVSPRSDCLEQLLVHQDKSECIHPLVVYEDGTEHEWEHILNPGSTHQIGLENRSFKQGKDWCAVNTACFEGMLVSRRILNVVGLPRKEFFVSGDDNLFGYLANMYTNVIYVRKAVLNKKIKPGPDRSPFKIYYDIRNRFILRSFLRSHHRHTAFDTMSFGLFVSLYAANSTIRPFRYAKARAAALALLDGIRGVSGRMRY
jgi:rhamnopyranosyl-N-acetylglucosaminyl-diphospho-decaprenol beta-1,3/1,4-galactofuranosyltransferase